MVLTETVTTTKDRTASEGKCTGLLQLIFGGIVAIVSFAEAHPVNAGVQYVVFHALKDLHTFFSPEVIRRVSEAIRAFKTGDHGSPDVHAAADEALQLLEARLTVDT